MTTRTLPLGVAVAVGLAAGVWWLARSSDVATPQRSRMTLERDVTHVSDSNLVATAPHTSDPPRPTLPDMPSDGATPLVDDSFAAEPVDRAWKATTEPELTKRLRPVQNVRGVECRSTRCLITITGTESEIAKAVDALESARELHALVRNILLTAPIRHDDGSIELRVLARFERFERPDHSDPDER
jgi:hypothetical protein